MEQDKTYTIKNQTDYEIRQMGWALARAGKTIHACKLFYDVFDYTLEHAKDYVRYLSGLETYRSEDQKRDKELGYL